MLWPERVRFDAAPLLAAAERYDVRILRDRFGVPHVYGKTDPDVAYGLAFAHSEDDFDTIQRTILASRGRLASVEGLDAVPADFLFHWLGVPEAICNRAPTTDTYSLAQGQDEFYFALPYPQMDLCLWGKNHGVAPAEVAPAVGLTADQVERVYRDIDQKRATTRYLGLAPRLCGEVPEISH